MHYSKVHRRMVEMGQSRRIRPAGVRRRMSVVPKKLTVDPGVQGPPRKEAARRDISVQRLVITLLDAIVSDELYVALLDRRPGPPPGSESARLRIRRLRIRRPDRRSVRTGRARRLAAVAAHAFWPCRVPDILSRGRTHPRAFDRP